MKRLVIIVLGIAAVLASCQKGENDPMFSIKPRKARLTGVWEAQSGEWSGGDTTYVFDGTTLTISDSSSSSDIGYGLTIEFLPSGEYSVTTVEAFGSNYVDSTLADESCTKVETGLWNFTGGAGNTKTKSQLLLIKEKSEQTCSNQPANVNTVTYVGQNKGVIYSIDRLSDQELTLKYDVEVVNSIGTYTKSGVFFFSKKPAQ